MCPLFRIECTGVFALFSLYQETCCSPFDWEHVLCCLQPFFPPKWACMQVFKTWEFPLKTLDGLISHCQEGLCISVCFLCAVNPKKAADRPRKLLRWLLFIFFYTLLSLSSNSVPTHLGQQALLEQRNNLLLRWQRNLPTKNTGQMLVRAVLFYSSWNGVIFFFKAYIIILSAFGRWNWSFSSK